MSATLSKEKSIEFLNIITLLFSISIVSSALPVLINIIYFQSISLSSSDFKFWFQLLVFERFLANIGILILMFTIQNSIPIYHFSVLFEFLIISKLFDLEKRICILNLLLFCAFLVFLSDLFLTSDLTHLNSLSSILTYSIIIGLGWYYIYSNTSLKKISTALISIFLYYLSSVFYLLFEHYSITNEKAFDSGFTVLVTLSILFNLSNSYITWSFQKN
jgi:hypothetical protein